MVFAGDFRNNVTFEMDGSVFQILEFQHVKPGKGAAFVRAKIRNIITGSTVERTFNPTDKFEKAQIDRRDMQYLYQDGELFYFMDEETYEQIPLNASSIGDALKFCKENSVCKLMFFKEQCIGIEPPTFVVLEITETEPGFKGDTATGANKPAIVETGATVKVPLFVNTGDRVKIDTRSGEYLERA